MTATLTAMVSAEHIVATHGTLLIDSRLLATHLKYDHRTVVKSIQRHKARLEAKEVVRQFVSKPPPGSSGGRPETYYLLDERQCLILTGSLKKGVEADEWHDALVDAFVEARARIRELEASQQHVAPPVRLLANLSEIPAGCFTIASELVRYLPTLQDILARSLLDDLARLEQSIGQRFARYAREVLHLPETHRHPYRHTLPNERIVHAWAYDLRYLVAFETWLWEVYFPEHFAEYERYRARRLGLALPAPAPRKQLAGPATRATRPAVTQLPLLADSSTR